MGYEVDDDDDQVSIGFCTGPAIIPIVLLMCVLWACNLRLATLWVFANTKVVQGCGYYSCSVNCLGSTD